MSTTSSVEPDLRFPIGKHDRKMVLTPAERGAALEALAAAPSLLRDAVSGLSDNQLDTPYRPGGWTVKQVVHHVPDSHMNAYTRFKLALTEDVPTIKTYEEAAWAELPDSQKVPIEVSLDLLDALHLRWLALLRSMDDTQFKRQLRHPEHGRVLSLEQMLGLYAWHGRHHVAHITSLRKREGW